MLRIAEHWYASDLGRQRQGNEDNFFVRAPLFVVADGMGGAQAGEVASEMAVRSFDAELPNSSLPEALVNVIETANKRIHERARADESLHGMGTTTTAAYVDDDEVVIAHVGDSRAYLLRNGDLVRLTKDHSLVGELVARGKLTEEQAEQHPQRSVITRALGPEANVQVDIDIFPAKAGDLFLLCSDGLTSMVHEPKLRPLFDEADSLEQLGKRLIDAANAAGGRDNITVILFRLEEVEARDGDGAAAAPAPQDEDTSEYDTFEGDAVQPPRQGVSRPTGLSDDEVLRSSEVSDATEQHYVQSGTVAVSAIQPGQQAPEGEAPAQEEAPAPAAPEAEEPPRRTAPLPDERQVAQAPPPHPGRADRHARDRLPHPRGRLDGYARRVLRRHRPARRPHDRDLPGAAVRPAARHRAVLALRRVGRDHRRRAAGAPHDVHRPQAALQGRRREPRDRARARPDRVRLAT